jgi:hypothetical protein
VTVAGAPRPDAEGPAVEWSGPDTAADDFEGPVTRRQVAELAALCDLLAAWVAAPPARPPLCQEADWRRFRVAAGVHGVAPLLGRRVGGEAGWQGSAAGDWLGDQYAANCRRVERLHLELRAVLARFAAAGVPLMPLKGAVLGVLCYADSGERPMADLDLLVHRHDLDRAVALLGELGYEEVSGGRKHLKLARAAAREIVDAGREHPDNPRWIELHPACCEWLDDEQIELTDCIWATASEAWLLGEPAWLPGPSAHWIYLLVHGSHHILINRFRLVQLLDLLRLEPHLPAGDAPDGLLTTLASPEVPAAILRAVYPPLALLERYFPADAADASGRGGLRRDMRERLAPGFAAWADDLDLYHACYLHPAPWRPQ